MFNDDYYTVNELSEKLGITKQAIYKRLKTDLSKYIIEQNEQKILHKSIIDEFNKNKKNTFKTQQDNYLNKINDNLKMQIEDKTTLIEKLFQQIESLTTQIKTLTTEVELQNKHTREQSTQLIGILKQVNELQRNNQILLSQNNEQTIEINNKNHSIQKNKKLFRWFK